MLQFLKRWFDYWIPSDELMEARPENHSEILKRMQEERARRGANPAPFPSAQNTTQSPIHRRGA